MAHEVKSEQETPQDIDPDRLYPFAEACKLIPSSQGGTINLRTLYRWKNRKVIKAECRKVVTRKFWFLRGSEIIRVLGLYHPEVVDRPRTQSEEQRDYEQAMAYLRSVGMDV